MRQLVMAVLDKSAQVFGRPIFVRSQAEAVRSFEAQVLEPRPQDGYTTPLSSHPQDFCLCQIGWFDDELGRFENLDIPLRLVEGASIAARVKSGG